LYGCGLFKPEIKEVEVIKEGKPPPQVTCNGFPVGSTRLSECPEGKQGNILNICNARGAWEVAQDTCVIECDESLANKTTFYDLKPVITENCVACHNVPQRFDEYAVAKNLARDFIFRVNANNVNRMPPASRTELSIEHKQMFQKWLDDGLLETDGCGRRDDDNEWILQDLDTIESRILADLNTLDARGRRESAYLVMSHKINQWKEQTELDAYRQGINKGLNSLSTDQRLTKATVVDARKGIYRVDLDVFDFLLTLEERRNGRIYDDWDTVVQEANKIFKFESFTSKGIQIKALTGRTQVWLHSDLYLLAAHKDNTYYQLLGIDRNQFKFFIDQDIDLNQQFADFEVTAGGGFGSPISLEKNRVIYRLNNAENYTYVTLDPNSVFVDEKNYFEFPCIFQMNCTENLLFDASEIIHTLPNKLQGYSLFNNLNVRQVFAPADVVSSAGADPFGEAQIDIGLDCHRCHSQGLLVYQDQIRDHFRANSSQYDANDLQLLNATYKGNTAINARFIQDINFYKSALAELDIDITKPDPINVHTDDFKASYTLRDFAGFLFISEAEARRCIDSSNRLRAKIGVLNSGGIISQAQFSDVFQIVLDECKVNEDPIDR
jgi:hypothetical protein